MTQSTLYYRTQLTTDVILFANQINGNMEEHLLENLKANIEGKVTENGNVIKVLKLVSYERGKIDTSNFSANVVFPIKYECFLCAPVKDMEMVAKVKNTTIKRIIIAVNGPVLASISLSDVDTTKFRIQDNDVYYVANDKIVSKNDYIKVVVTGANNIKGSRNIMAVCKLVDMASPSEIERFKKDKVLVHGETDDDEMI